MTDFSRRDFSRALGLGAGLVAAASMAKAGQAAGAGAAAAPASGLALDHIVWAVPDLDKGIRQIADLTGIEPVSGGKAPGRDRPHNALLSLGGGAYLEIFSPLNANAEGPWKQAITDGEPHIVGYALRVTDRFARLKADLGRNGYSFTGPRAMGRVRPDGGAVKWELLHGKGTPFDGALPFFIDWLGSTPHPSESSPKGATIESFTVTHPRADELAKLYRDIGIETPVIRGNRHGLNLTLATPKGRLFLR